MAEVIIKFENGIELKCFSNGDIFRSSSFTNGWVEVPNTAYASDGYNWISINYKKVLRQNLIMFAFRDYDYENSHDLIHHIDKNKLNLKF